MSDFGGFTLKIVLPLLKLERPGPAMWIWRVITPTGQMAGGKNVNNYANVDLIVRIAKEQKVRLWWSCKARHVFQVQSISVAGWCMNIT